MCKLFIFSLFFCLTSLFSDLVPKGETRSCASLSKVYDEWTLELDDNSCWKLFPELEKNQSWGEWWNGTEPEQPDERFIFDIQDWKEARSLQVYLDTSKGVHLIEEATTGKCIRARLCNPNKLFVPSTTMLSGFLENPIGDRNRIAKKFNLNGRTICIFDDDSIWQLYPTSKNRQSWSQWWNGQEPDQPDEAFITDLSSWHLGHDVQLFAFNWEVSSIAEIYGASGSTPYQATFLLQNQATGRCSFAKSLAVADFTNFMLEYADERYSTGYSNGRSAGYHKGKRQGLKNGHKEGYKEGFKEGFKSADKPPSYDEI